MTSTLLIRADGSAAIGTGHVMRCLALAQAWRHAGGNAIFAQAETTPSLDTRLKYESLERASVRATRGSADDAAETVLLARERGVSWIVADGYCFDSNWQKQIREAGLRLLVVDDYGQAEHYHADLVLNQNLSASESLYSRRDADTRILLGPSYALLRREFSVAANPPRETIDAARKVLVTLGGSDPDQVTAKVLAGLQNLPDIEVVVVAGGSNPHLETLKAAVASSKCKTSVVVDAPNMSELMAWADVAVAAAGSTSWELAATGLPAVQLILAENQAPIADALHRAGAAINLGDFRAVTSNIVATRLYELLSDPRRRRDMSSRGLSLVDGRGATRVVAYIWSLEIGLRRARLDDSRMLWQWANDPVVRASSFCPDSIEWESHVAWFRRKLECPASAIFVGLDLEGRPFGQVRFDWTEDGVAEVAVSVDSDHRHTGLGSALIRRAVDEFFPHEFVQLAKAYIKRENRASIGAFTKAGFRLVGETQVRNHEALCLTMGPRQ